MSDSMAEYRRLIGSLKARRLQLKLTQVEVSIRMGVDVNLVNRWENFHQFPKGPGLIEWAQELGLNLTVGLPRPSYVPFSDEEQEGELRKLAGQEGC